jgi:hypothetical protein
LTGRHGGLSPSIVGADDVARVDLLAPDEFVEGFAAKHLRAKGKKAMEINRADVAELVDARDLKFSAPAENKAVFRKTPAKFLAEPARTNVICKTLPASEFQQRRVQQDSTRLMVMPLPNGALMSVTPK